MTLFEHFGLSDTKTTCLPTRSNAKILKVISGILGVPRRRACPSESAQDEEGGSRSWKILFFLKFKF